MSELLNSNWLALIMACKPKLATQWLEPINKAMEKYEINTKLRMAHFLAQIGHESGGLVYVLELASGKAYEGRKDLGNVQVGDGVKYKGRGLIQITGRANYKACSDALGVNFEQLPALLESKDNAAMSAAWYWNLKKLNVLADADDVLKITKKINGGTNGLDDRKTRLLIAKAAFN